MIYCARCQSQRSFDKPQTLAVYHAKRDLKLSFRFFSTLLAAVAFFGTICGMAHAADITMYRLDKIPDLTAFLIKEGEMFAVFGDATVSLETDELYGKLLLLDEKKRCTDVLYTDSDKSWSSKPCVSARRQSDGSYLVDVTIKYRFPDYVKDEIDLLKAADHVKERRYRILFDSNPSDCSANVIERTFIPLGGNKPKPSRTGPIGCSSAMR